MTIKIDAPKLWSDAEEDGFLYGRKPTDSAKGHWVRTVRESDWRKVMAVVGAADRCGSCCPVTEPMNALRKHLSKRK